MSKYNIRWRKMLSETLPFILRNTLTDLIFVIIKPLRDIYFRFRVCQTDSAVKLSYNSQYPNLQRLMNDLYDPIDRNIVVADADYIAQTLIFPNVEKRPIVIGQITIYLCQRYGYNGFTVILPDTQAFKNIEDKLKSTLHQYLFSGIKYQIIYG